MKIKIPMTIKLNKWTWSFLLISSVYCFVEQVICADSPELFTNANEFGNFVAAICYSYIVSAIFYLVVFQGEVNKKVVYHSHFFNKANTMISNADLLLKYLEKHTKMNLSCYDSFVNDLEWVDLQIKTSMFKGVAEKLDGKIEILYRNLLEVMIFLYQKTKEEYSDVVPYLPFIDAELADIVNKLFSSEYFKSLELVIIEGDTIHDLREISNVVFEYFELIGKLKLALKNLQSKYSL